jgi:hypothetical protein
LATAAGILLSLLLALALLVLALLAVPLDLCCHAEGGSTLRWTVRVRWLFGLVRVQRTGSGEAAAGTASPKPGKQARKVRGRSQGRRIPPFAKERVFVKRAFRLLRTLAGRITIRRASADVRIGLADPADTGVLYGIMAPALVMLDGRFPGGLTVTPDFTGERLAGNAEGDIRVVPLGLVPPIMSFAVWLAAHAWHGRRNRR